jgi:phosphoglycerate dehydrogenase-like enzyme
LDGDNVVILGYGAIARRLVALLAPFRLNIVALRRKPTGDEKVPTYRIEEVSSHLSDCDHLFNILPASESTHKFVDSTILGQLKAGAAFYNVGRGTTVDQTALVEALRCGQISVAMLDVTDPEPLPHDHPLWKAPNCTITPHIAGGMQGEDLALVNHFLANLTRLESGQELLDTVF